MYIYGIPGDRMGEDQFCSALCKWKEFTELLNTIVQWILWTILKYCPKNWKYNSVARLVYVPVLLEAFSYNDPVHTSIEGEHKINAVRCVSEKNSPVHYLVWYM